MTACICCLSHTCMCLYLHRHFCVNKLRWIDDPLPGAEMISISKTTFISICKRYNGGPQSLRRLFNRCRSFRSKWYFFHFLTVSWKWKKKVQLRFRLAGLWAPKTTYNILFYSSTIFKNFWYSRLDLIICIFPNFFFFKKSTLTKTNLF